MEAMFLLESLGARVSIYDGVRSCVAGGFLSFFFGAWRDAI